MSANLEGKCPHCGSPKHGTLTTHWQDAYQCWTVYPHDGPHRRGAICIELCKGQEATKAVNEWIDKTDWVQRNETGLFDNMLGWHRADCMRTAIDRLRAQIAALQSVPQGVEVPELTDAFLDLACGPDLSGKADLHSAAFRDLSRLQYRRGWEDLAARLVPTPPQPLQPEERRVGPDEVVVGRKEHAGLLELAYQSRSALDELQNHGECDMTGIAEAYKIIEEARRSLCTSAQAHNEIEKEN